MASMHNEATQQKTKGLAIPPIWLKVRGMLKGRGVNSLRYQKKIRQEWEERLKKLHRKHGTR